VEVYIVIWIVCGFVAAAIASSRGAAGGAGFILGILFGPFGILIACFMGGEAEKTAKQVSTGAKKICPRCAEAVQPAAQVCRYCGHEFQEMVAEDAVETSPEESSASDKDNTVMGVVGIFLVLFLLAAFLLSGMPR
jgi:ribosomal protein L40E